jgi:hypothetical protein
MTAIELIAILSAYPEETKVVVGSDFGFWDIDEISVSILYSEESGRESEMITIRRKYDG